MPAVAQLKDKHAHDAKVCTNDTDFCSSKRKTVAQYHLTLNFLLSRKIKRLTLTVTWSSQILVV
eukprot:m.163354 g.163354  ORF g.163354 m.163354 type:complete len:64 (-) comp12296_c0_seq1:5854-6045(-)